MKMSEETLDDFVVAYPLEELAPLEQILFLDIETTGFTAASSNLYMIGCVYYQARKWHTIQWLAEKYDEEADVLRAFFSFSEHFKCLIHFNGNNFDLPYIQQKCTRLTLPYTLDGMEGVDLYKRIAPYKSFLRLSNCKQKTIEEFLKVFREDTFSGGELINLYHDYVKAPTKFLESTLFLHNADDIKGMLSILPILSYSDLFQKQLATKKVQANSYRDFGGNTKKELLITLALPSPLPQSFSTSVNSCYLRAEGNEATLRVPIYEEELKYFYANYKDYYYLPNEDVALHKSVATFVDKQYRTQATAASCYTRKHSLYLPQWDIWFEPFFKRDYHSKDLFFELTDEIKQDRVAFTTYAGKVLAMMASTH